MKTEDKKAARAAYKERKQVAGIFAIRCAPSGEVWVGQTLTLLTIQNRLWFMLTHGRPEIPGDGEPARRLEHTRPRQPQLRGIGAHR